MSLFSQQVEAVATALYEERRKTLGVALEASEVMEEWHDLPSADQEAWRRKARALLK